MSEPVPAVVPEFDNRSVHSTESGIRYKNDKLSTDKLLGLNLKKINKYNKEKIKGA